MTDNELLAKVKAGLGITSNFTDNTIKIYIGEVKQALIAAGVKRSVVESEKSVGCILIGVNDLWNYTGGGTKLSDYFEKRAIQLASEG